MSNPTNKKTGSSMKLKKIVEGFFPHFLTDLTEDQLSRIVERSGVDHNDRKQVTRVLRKHNLELKLESYMRRGKRMPNHISRSILDS